MYLPAAQMAVNSYRKKVVNITLIQDENINKNNSADEQMPTPGCGQVIVHFKVFAPV